MKRLSLIAFALTIVSLQPRAQTQTSSPVRSMVENYCVSCHSTTMRAGGIAFAGMPVDTVGDNAELAPKLHLIVLGDVGGGGANSDYQFAGALGYELNKKWTLSAGYRYMAVNYRPNTPLGFVNDTVTSGIIVGATWSIK